MTRKPGPLAALAVVALIGAGAGCSNDSSNGAASNNGAANVSADNPEQGVKFAECMRENGVSDFPDPNAKGQFVYGVSVSPAAWKQAVGACKELQPPGTLSAERPDARPMRERKPINRDRRCARFHARLSHKG